MRSVDYTDLMTREWPKDIIIGVPGRPEDSILSRGDRMVIAGEQKTGKSVLLGQLMRGLVLGTEFLGFPIPQPRKVLYVQAELRESSLKKRYKAAHERLVQRGLELPPGRLLVWSTNGPLYLTGYTRHEKQQGVQASHGLEKLYEEIDEVKPDVVVLDPLASFHDIDESKASEVKLLFDELDRIKERVNAELGGVALVIAHHFRKTSGMDKQFDVPLINQVRGSSALAGWADSILCIGVHEGVSDSKYIEFTLRDTDVRPERTLTYNYDIRGFDWSDPRIKLIEAMRPRFEEGPVERLELALLVKDMLYKKSKNGHQLALTKIEDLVRSGLLVVVDGGIDLPSEGGSGDQPETTPPLAHEPAR